MSRTLDVICVVCGILQILQVDARVRHNEELLGPLRSIEAPQDEFGRAARRGRIDILGLILKKRIAHLRRAGQTELVFLVDSSASVGSDNFYNEIKFIRKLLADFTVSSNSTRVVVITYSSVDRVLRQVDHISGSFEGFHKCRLLDAEIPSITYNSGGTYTLGALQQALDVLKLSRKKASRAVFLITDGYSNGGDPRPAAETLKSLNVEIFTFGIRNGNIKELRDMASEPKDEHSYILDSFIEFEALARRALHEDLSAGVYLPQADSACNQLCTRRRKSDKELCCDPTATCSCGTHTGHYACLCPKGHYGQGFIGDCTPCPMGTYKPTLEPGDKRSCIQCPSPDQTSPLGSWESSQCQCKEGYILHLGKCQLRACSHLSPPENGRFSGTCSNLFNSACGIHCNSGFELHGGSPVRICLPNGQWSGTQPRCIPKKCRMLRAPRNGEMICSHNSKQAVDQPAGRSLDQVGAHCQFSCQTGYRLVGSPSRFCLPVALWTGLPAYCKPVKCGRLRQPAFGAIYPESCGQRKMPYRQRCAFACQPGFRLQGPSLRECILPGSWTGGTQSTRCIDVTPPVINCPEDVTVNTDPGLYYATVNISMPTAFDNSGILPTISSIPALQPSMKFKIGLENVMVQATDVTGNVAKCSFSITVKDVEPPVVDFCESPPIFLVKNERDLARNKAQVEWDPPIFHDNSLGDALNVTLSIHGQSASDLKTKHILPIGKTTEIIYEVSDSAGNNAQCQMEITLQAHYCLLPPDPINGHKNCTQDDEAVYCSLSCMDGYAFAIQPPTDYYQCSFEDESGLLETDTAIPVMTPGNWIPTQDAFPDCAVVTHSNSFFTPSQLQLEMDANEVSDSFCDDPFFVQQVTHQTRLMVQQKLAEVCGDVLYCDISDMETVCGQVLEESKNARPKRDLQRNTVTINFKVMSEGNENLDLIGQKLRESGQQTVTTAGGKQLRAREIVLEPPTFFCPNGTISRGNLCIRCPPGTFQASAMHCQVCDIATYQPLDGQMHCFDCPAGRSTRYLGSKNRRSCRQFCGAGSFSRDGLAPCTTCRVGYFQPQTKSRSCQKCPDDTATWRRGAKNSQECQSLCLPGLVSETGLASDIDICLPCPKGYFQEAAGQRGCLKCPSRVGIEQAPENNEEGGEEGSHSSVGLSSILQCPGVEKSTLTTSVLSQLEFLRINECFKDPCLNGGKCEALKNGFICRCQSGYQGSLCQLEIDYCLSQPCANGGICQNMREGYQCLCSAEFSGQNCEFDRDECLSENPCQNGGECINEAGGYICLCLEGFKGDNCEEKSDKCATNICVNGGTCFGNYLNFTCSCPSGFTGMFCEWEENECTSNPCQNGGQCVASTVDTYFCACVNGFSGTNCELDLDGCGSSPCQNNGTCVNEENGLYKCQCGPGFAGDQCQIELPSDYVMTFGASDAFATSEYVLLEGKEIPQLNEFSFCFWMKTDDLANYGTVLSYATETEDNELTFTDYGGFVLSVKGQKVVTDITANDGTWTFLCALWRSLQGFWAIFVNGQLMDSGRHLAENLQVSSGGVLVLGQEQDAPGGRFSSAESFRGQLTRLNFWSRFLTEAEINQAMNSCLQMSGDLLAWSDFYPGIHGFIEVNELTPCTGCSPLESPNHGHVTILNNNRGPLIRILDDDVTARQDINQSSLYDGQLAQYSCQVGYHLEPPEYALRRCGTLGHWAGMDPICRLTRCGYPGQLTNGQMIGRSYLFGDVVHYSCDRGYKLEGPQSRVCTENGTWSGADPICQEVVCAFDEFQFVHGQVENSIAMKAVMKRGNISYYSVGTQIALYCDHPDAELEGFSNLKCTAKGTWDHEIPICHQLPCSQLPQISHGIVVQADQEEPPFYSGAEIVFQCHPGYEIRRVRHKLHNRLACQDNGLWAPPRSYQSPKCFPIQCSPPASDPFGRIVNQPPLVLTYNSTLEIICIPGYQLPQGNRHQIVRCNESGGWESVSNQESRQRCRPVECKFPQDVQNGMVEFSGLRVGSMARYSCERPYVLKGRAQRRCLYTGHWSHRTPLCTLQ